MGSFSCSDIPRCTIDYPMELSPEEIVSLCEPVNTLLKESYLLGSFFDTANSLEHLFDIAEEIAGVEACGWLLSPEPAPGTWDLKASRRIQSSPEPEVMQYLVAPAAIASHFNKGISMDPQWGPWSQPICDAWSSRSLVCFPMRRDREVFGAIVFGKRESHPFTTTQVKLLWALSMQAEIQLHRSETVKALATYSNIDPLTHLYNRQYFNSQLNSEILRSRRTGFPFSLLMLDIDGFKAYNKRFLNTPGDIALQEFAGILGTCARDVDTVARIGEDEFAVILFESNADGAWAFSERIIQRFRRHALPDGEGKRTEHLSLSIGVATFPSDSFEKSDLIAKADRALSTAKSRGGGQTCIYPESSFPGNGNVHAPELPLRKVYDAGRSVVDMDKFLEVLLFTAMQGLDAKRASIVVQDATDTFTLRAAIGFGRSEEHLAYMGSIRPGPVTSWVVEHQLPLVVSNPSDCPFQRVQKQNGYTTDSFLSIPLIHTGRTLGVLHLTNRKDKRPFAGEDLRSFAPIAAQIAKILNQGMRFRENMRVFTLSKLVSLSNALEVRFPFLSGHFNRVRDLSARIGEQMGLAGYDLENLQTAAGLHDVGLVGTPGNILQKKRNLNQGELEMVRTHPILGAKLLEGIPGLETAQRTILEHHENFDGSGYPSGLYGQDISIHARILAAAEFYDSITSDRPHRERIRPEAALEMIRSGGGTLFDPEVSGVFVKTIGAM